MAGGASHLDVASMNKRMSELGNNSSLAAMAYLDKQAGSPMNLGLGLSVS
jgi:hypothetical protein